MHHRFSLLATALAAAALAGCGGESAPTAAAPMDEFVPGYKRLAGTFQRKAEFSRTPRTELGPPDVTLEVSAAIAGFTPNELRVKQGQVVELALIGVDNGQLPALTGIDRFTGHGFHLSAYDIWICGLRAGVERRIKFRATRAGTFTFECPVFCSVDHYKMNGRFVVEPAPVW